MKKPPPPSKAEIHFAELVGRTKNLIDTTYTKGEPLRNSVDAKNGKGNASKAKRKRAVRQSTELLPTGQMGELGD